MNEFLRLEFIGNNILYLLPFLVVAGVLAILPALRIYNYWLVERSLDARWAIPLLGGHALMLVILWSQRLYGAVVLYEALVLAIVLAGSLFSGILDWFSIRGLVERDIKRYRYMLALDPNNANALIGLANAYLDRGRKDEAIAAYEKAKAIDPLHTQVASARLQNMVHARVRQNIGKDGVAIITQNKDMVNLDDKVSMEVMRNSREDEPVIPEL